MSKADLEQALKDARATLAAAEAALEAWDDMPENNVFLDMGTAVSVIEDALLDVASNDCEGSYNRGADTYTRGFIVNGARYIGTLYCEYNRHDKTYYYIDRHSFDYVAA